MRILIVPNADNPSAVAWARSLADALRADGHDVQLTLADAAACGIDSGAVSPSMVGAPDLAVALGGDGTILKTVHVLAGADTPVMGINLGRLGFLSGAGDADPLAAIRAAIAGEARVETRATLAATVIAGGRMSGTHEALNEIFVGRGVGARAVDIAVDVDGERLARWVCDGLIVATPTGSTAYALSAGGPLLAPDVSGLLIVPVSAHSLQARPIVVSDAASIVLTFPDPTRADACIVVDGDVAPCRSALEEVRVAAGTAGVRLLRLEGRGFVTALHDTFLS
jgi:NAD+ kinase